MGFSAIFMGLKADRGAGYRVSNPDNGAAVGAESTSLGMLVGYHNWDACLYLQVQASTDFSCSLSVTMPSITRMSCHEQGSSEEDKRTASCAMNTG